MDAGRIPIFRRERSVRDADCDILGHVNNAVWVEFVVELAEAHSKAVGLGFDVTRTLGGVWIVRRHEIDYRRDARPGERIREETWVSEMRGARSVRHARFLDEADCELVIAITEWAFVDGAGGRPRRVPPEVAERFDLIAAPAPRVRRRPAS